MRKFLLPLLLGGALMLTAQNAWALPWEGWVTSSEEFSKEMLLGRQLFFNYESINGNPATQTQGDILLVKTQSGTVIGSVSELDGTYPDWKKVVMQVPDSLLFTTQTLWFSTQDVGPRTDPRWVFNGINSPVPEPATFLLFGSAMLGLAGLRKRKR
jgi:hypothetical protein